MAICVLFLGDIVGAAGRQAVAQVLPGLRERFDADLVIANAENAANGSGLTPEQYGKLCAAGVDGITLGDHVYRKKQIVGTLEREGNIVRPANLPRKAAGKRWMRLRVAQEGTEGSSVYVLTVLGRLFMTMPVTDVFTCVDEVIAELPESRPIVIVEAHMEATSEKQALGWYLNGRVAAVLGSHTHVPTADERVLPADPATGARGPGGGTAYLTDLGMCGPYDSVLGRMVDRVLTHMTTGMPSPFDVAAGNPRVCGAAVWIEPTSGLATRIERFDVTGT